MKQTKYAIILASIASIFVLIKLFAGFAHESNNLLEYDTKEYIVQNDINETNIMIEYPVFSINRNNYNAINDYIYEIVVKEQLDRFDDSLGLYYNSDYTIKLISQEYISVMFEAEYYMKKAAYPVDVAFCLTFDVKTGTVVDLYNFIGKTDVISNIENKSFSVVKAVNDFLTDPVFEAYMSVDDLNGFYITEEAIGLIFILPHVAGDYAIIEIASKWQSYKL